MGENRENSRIFAQKGIGGEGIAAQKLRQAYLANGFAKPKFELVSAMRISSLYFAMRSEREREPVLIWPVPRPTAR